MRVKVGRDDCPLDTLAAAYPPPALNAWRCPSSPVGQAGRPRFEAGKGRALNPPVNLAAHSLARAARTGRADPRHVLAWRGARPAPRPTHPQAVPASRGDAVASWRFTSGCRRSLARRASPRPVARTQDEACARDRTSRGRRRQGWVLKWSGTEDASARQSRGPSLRPGVLAPVGPTPPPRAAGREPEVEPAQRSQDRQFA